MRSGIKCSVLVLVAVSIASLLMAAPLEKQPRRSGEVIAEPLHCLQSDRRLICFDGTPLGKQVCTNLTFDTVLCTPAH
jgi:hypothetical protein